MSPTDTRKSWTENLADDKGLPRVGRIEGHKVILRGKRAFVTDHERKLLKFSI